MREGDSVWVGGKRREGDCLGWEGGGGGGGEGEPWISYAAKDQPAFLFLPLF